MKKVIPKVCFVCLFTFLFSLGFAIKDRAPIFLEARAMSKTRQINALLTTIAEKYWIVDITLRNDGQDNFPIDVAKFSVLGSDGYSANYSNISEIPARSLFSSITVRPRDVVRGSLGFKLKSKEAYPMAIIYETTFLVSTGQVYLVTPAQLTQPTVREESPYNTRNIIPLATPTPSPQEKEEQRIRNKAAREATVARDSVRAELEVEIVNKYIKLQDDNKSDYEKKKISFDQFMQNKGNLDRKKQKELLDTSLKGDQVYQETYTKVTSDYYRQKK